MARDDRPFPRPNLFVAAARGILLGVTQERTFVVHVAAAVAVIVAAIWLRTNPVESALLALCVAGVWSAELFNSALERLARAIDRNANPLLRDALDLAAGAVLAFALGAAVVGGIILGGKFF